MLSACKRVVSVFVAESNFCSQYYCLDVLVAPSWAGEAEKRGERCGVGCFLQDQASPPTPIPCALRPCSSHHPRSAAAGANDTGQHHEWGHGSSATVQPFDLGRHLIPHPWESRCAFLSPCINALPPAFTSSLHRLCPSGVQVAACAWAACCSLD